MQQLELFPELKYPFGVEFTNEKDIYVSVEGIYFHDGIHTDCEGCVFEDVTLSKLCVKSEKIVDCFEHPIIWVKKG